MNGGYCRLLDSGEFAIPLIMIYVFCILTVNMYYFNKQEKKKQCYFAQESSPFVKPRSPPFPPPGLVSPELPPQLLPNRMPGLAAPHGQAGIQDMKDSPLTDLKSCRTQSSASFKGGTPGQAGPALRKGVNWPPQPDAP